jgi:hypothetical protein
MTMTSRPARFHADSEVCKDVPPRRASRVSSWRQARARAYRECSRVSSVRITVVRHGRSSTARPSAALTASGPATLGSPPSSFLVCERWFAGQDVTTLAMPLAEHLHRMRLAENDWLTPAKAAPAGFCVRLEAPERVPALRGLGAHVAACRTDQCCATGDVPNVQLRKTGRPVEARRRQRRTRSPPNRSCARPRAGAHPNSPMALRRGGGARPHWL